MAFHIRSQEADKALRDLQALTGESLTEAVTRALQERLEREKERRGTESKSDVMAVLEGIWKRLEGVPNRDPRPDDEILGYGPDGLPS
jgi:antitoxin VapB